MIGLVYRVQVSEPAIQDAQDYATFIKEERQAPEAARKWLDGLQEELAALRDEPAKFDVIAEAEELGFPYRSFGYHSHRVIFGVYEDENLVIVHRIYHGARQSLEQEDL